MTGTLLLDPALRAVTREIDPAVDPLDAVAVPRFAWLHDGVEIVAGGSIATLDAADVEQALARIDHPHDVDVAGVGPIAVGALPFDPGAPRRLTIPAVTVVRRDGRAWTTELGPADGIAAPPVSAPSRFDIRAIEDRAAWQHAVTRALDAIERREIDKVVLSRAVQVEGDQPFDVRTVLTRLRAQQPGCFVYASDGLVGATPELLVRRTGAVVESRPLAGTAVDAEQLECSDKDLAEHRYVVEALARELECLCDRLDVPTRPEILRFRDLVHFATSIRGRLREPAPSALDVTRCLHPTPAVAGTPAARALGLIERLEQSPRGRYAGPVGWVGARGDGEWGVAIRGAELDGRRAVLRTGAGIVAGSDPDREWDETSVKLDPMLRALVRV